MAPRERRHAPRKPSGARSAVTLLKVLHAVMGSFCMSESRFRTHARGWRLRRGLAGATTLALASFALAACESEAAPGPEGTRSEVSSTPTPRPDPVRVTSNLRDGAAVPVDKTVQVS